MDLDRVMNLPAGEKLDAEVERVVFQREVCLQRVIAVPQTAGNLSWCPACQKTLYEKPRLGEPHIPPPPYSTDWSCVGPVTGALALKGYLVEIKIGAYAEVRIGHRHRKSTISHAMGPIPAALCYAALHALAQGVQR